MITLSLCIILKSTRNKNEWKNEQSQWNEFCDPEQNTCPYDEQEINLGEEPTHATSTSSNMPHDDSTITKDTTYNNEKHLDRAQEEKQEEVQHEQESNSSMSQEKETSQTPQQTALKLEEINVQEKAENEEDVLFHTEQEDADDENSLNMDSSAYRFNFILYQNKK